MLVEVVKWVFGRTDPVIGSVLVAMWLYGWRKCRRLDEHIADGNANPHMMCCEPHKAEIAAIHGDVADAIRHGDDGRDSMKAEILALMERQRVENREDHQEIFRILRGCRRR